MSHFFAGLAALGLLLVVNGAPQLTSLLLGSRMARPLDGGRRFRDGKPLLGAHKTWRGLFVSVVSGALFGWLLGFGPLLGTLAGLAAMLGDCATSFAKRRLDRLSGAEVAGLDQLPEGALPLAVLWAAGVVSGVTALLTLAAFAVLALWLSRKALAVQEIVQAWGSPLLAWREWNSCAPKPDWVRLLTHVKEILLYRLGIVGALYALGLLRRGRKNALGLRLTRLAYEFGNLPPAFDGYRMVLLTDPHLDGLDGLAERLAEMLAELRPDILLLGGDYRYDTHGGWTAAMRRMERVLRDCRPADGTWAVLGNHDCLPMAEDLVGMGARVLFNQAVVLRRGGQRIHLVGLDEPRYFARHEPAGAMQGIPAGEFTVVLAHAPDAAPEVAGLGADLYLCGHTHAGQIKLPVLGTPVTHSRAPKSIRIGAWQLNGMRGYTSHGAGVSGAPVRFGTRGELVEIVLRAGG